MMRAVTDQTRAKVAFLWESESSYRALAGPSSLVASPDRLADQPDLVDRLFFVAREVFEGDDRVLIVTFLSRLLNRLVSVRVSIIFDVRNDTHACTHTHQLIHQFINSNHSSHLPGQPAGGVYGYSFYCISEFLTVNFVRRKVVYDVIILDLQDFATIWVCRSNIFSVQKLMNPLFGVFFSVLTT